MALIPDNLKLTSAETTALEEIRRVARKRHEKERSAAKARGRHSFPESPYEDSWAFEEEFRRGYRDGTMLNYDAEMKGRVIRP